MAHCCQFHISALERPKPILYIQKSDDKLHPANRMSCTLHWLFGWSLMSLFSTNTAISETSTLRRANLQWQWHIYDFARGCVANLGPSTASLSWIRIDIVKLVCPPIVIVQNPTSNCSGWHVWSCIQEMVARSRVLVDGHVDVIMISVIYTIVHVTHAVCCFSYFHKVPLLSNF